jgi:IS5 family transposase
VLGFARLVNRQYGPGGSLLYREAKGVKRIRVPNLHQEPRAQTGAKKRWFRHGQKWRRGCEGRISVTKRRYGLTRCRYKGKGGMKCWVRARCDLRNIGWAIPKQSPK